MIQLICFDIDDTLMDFHKGEKIAFMSSMKEFGILSSEEDYLLYENINRLLWEALERGEITKDLLRIKRFDLFKEKTKYQFDSYKMNDIYVNHLSEQCFLFEHALDVVKKSQKYGDLAVTTNGISSVQRKRLNQSGLISYFKYLFISEEIGYAKPHKKYYEAIFEKSGYDANQIVCIGDSISADMKGAVDSGCISIWYNPKHLENRLNLNINYEIDDLTQIISILEELS